MPGWDAVHPGLEILQTAEAAVFRRHQFAFLPRAPEQFTRLRFIGWIFLERLLNAIAQFIHLLAESDFAQLGNHLLKPLAVPFQFGMGWMSRFKRCLGL